MERREFIKQTAAIASMTAVGAANAKSTTEKRPADRCLRSIVLVDDRFSDSRTFAAVYAQQGATIVALSEDIGRLWYGQLGEICSQSDIVIAGLTLHTDLFVSQQFARERGKSLLQFGVHECRGRRTLTHYLPAKAGLQLFQSESWAAEVARSMLNSHSMGIERVAQASQIVRAGDHPGSLYSWMIV
jgi:hypothetical protein